MQRTIQQRLLDAVDVRVKIMSTQDHIQVYTLNGEAVTFHDLYCPCARCCGVRAKEKTEREGGR